MTWASLRVKPPEAGFTFRSLGGATRGCAQQAPRLLGPQDEQDGVDQRVLADTRPARDDERPAGQRLLERGLLAGRKLVRHDAVGLPFSS